MKKSPESPFGMIRGFYFCVFYCLLLRFLLFTFAFSTVYFCVFYCLLFVTWLATRFRFIPARLSLCLRLFRLRLFGVVLLLDVRDGTCRRLGRCVIAAIGDKHAHVRVMPIALAQTTLERGDAVTVSGVVLLLAQPTPGIRATIIRNVSSLQTLRTLGILKATLSGMAVLAALLAVFRVTSFSAMPIAIALLTLPARFVFVTHAIALAANGCAAILGKMSELATNVTLPASVLIMTETTALGTVWSAACVRAMSIALTAIALPALVLGVTHSLAERTSGRAACFRTMAIATAILTLPASVLTVPHSPAKRASLSASTSLTSASSDCNRIRRTFIGVGSSMSICSTLLTLGWLSVHF